MPGPSAAPQRGGFEGLIRAVFRRAARLGLRPACSRVAVDSTGLEARHASVHFIYRRARGRALIRTPGYPTLTVACDTATHLWAGAAVGRGPCNEAPFFAPVVRQAAGVLTIDQVLGDAAFDTERCHALCRDRLKIRSTVIPLNPRGGGRKWPRTRYRRQMRRRFFTRAYGQRWQVESSFSSHKRRLGSALRATSETGREAESWLRVLTHNLLILWPPSGISTEQPEAYTTACAI